MGLRRVTRPAMRVLAARRPAGNETHEVAVETRLQDASIARTRRSPVLSLSLRSVHLGLSRQGTSHARDGSLLVPNHGTTDSSFGTSRRYRWRRAPASVCYTRSAAGLYRDLYSRRTCSPALRLSAPVASRDSLRALTTPLADIRSSLPNAHTPRTS